MCCSDDVIQYREIGINNQKIILTSKGAGPGGVLEHWSATENVTGVLERSEKKGWSARVLELRKTSWSAGKLRKIGCCAGALILNCLER